MGKFHSIRDSRSYHKSSCRKKHQHQPQRKSKSRLISKSQKWPNQRMIETHFQVRKKDEEELQGLKDRIEKRKLVREQQIAERAIREKKRQEEEKAERIRKEEEEERKKKEEEEKK